MIAEDLPPSIQTTRPLDVAIAWTSVLLLSDLPDAVCRDVIGVAPVWLILAKIISLLTIIAFAAGWERFYRLRSFFVLLLIGFLSLKAMRWLRWTPTFMQQREDMAWLLRMSVAAGCGLLLTLTMLGYLLVIGKRRKDLFLTTGDLRFWKIPGTGIAVGVMVMTYFFFDYRLPSAATAIKALPLMPAAILFAAIFAFNEEIVFRATLIASLDGVLGKGHVTALTAFFFGISHYFGGTPANVEGALIAGGLGWLWAKMMFETRGIFMSWLNHFFNNIPTLVFWAFASVSA